METIRSYNQDKLKQPKIYKEKCLKCGQEGHNSTICKTEWEKEYTPCGIFFRGHQKDTCKKQENDAPECNIELRGSKNRENTDDYLSIDYPKNNTKKNEELCECKQE